MDHRPIFLIKEIQVFRDRKKHSNKSGGPLSVWVADLEY